MIESVVECSTSPLYDGAEVHGGMLTDHLKVNKETFNWLSPDLTLVETGIPRLGKLQL